MRTSTRLALVVMVLLGGFCAALPFRKPQTFTSPPTIATGEPKLVLRHVVPLSVSGRSEPSPAQGLYDEQPRTPPTGRRKIAAIRADAILDYDPPVPSIDVADGSQVKLAGEEPGITPRAAESSAPGAGGFPVEVAEEPWANNDTGPHLVPVPLDFFQPRTPIVGLSGQ